MIVVLLLTAIIASYIYATKNFSYWSKRNVKHIPPIPLFGNHFPNQIGFKSIVEISMDLYKQYPKEKVVGYYRGPTPELIVKDLDILRQIMSVEFSSFFMRGLGRNVEVEPLFRSLFHAEGDSWRLLRQRLTPVFTTAKLRAMFPLITKCTEKLQKGTSGVCDAREIIARFTTDFIGTCGFGIEMDTINNERSEFRALGKRIFRRSWRSRILVPLVELFPELKELISIDSKSLYKCIAVIFEKIREQRGYKTSGRNDFIDLLIELEAKGKIKGESIEKRNADGSPMPIEMEMDFTCMVAQVFIFFAAGFETSSSTASYTLHELAYNKDIQRKIHKEIDEVMLRYDNKLCYDAIVDMHLLDMAFKEGMRKFPALGVLNRVCTRKYKIPELDITIDPGVRILIPVQAIQMDEKYYDNPQEFRPERFRPEEVQKRHKFAYLPFGEGPRACVGAKLGHIQALAGLATILHTFEVSPAQQSRREIIVDHTLNVVQGVKNGLPLTFDIRSP